MRDDLLGLELGDIAWFLALLELTERQARSLRRDLPTSVDEYKQRLQSHLASRAAGRADATTRPDVEPVLHPDDEELDTDEVARRLGVSSGAVRKACRPGGRFAGIARKRRGRWAIPAADIEYDRKGA